MTDKIRIGPVDFDIEYHKTLVSGDNSTKLDGEILHQISTIRLEMGTSPQFRRMILWHEIVHAILTQAGYHDHDEQMMEVLASGIMQVLRDNPWLIEIYPREETDIDPFYSSGTNFLSSIPLEEDERVITLNQDGQEVKSSGKHKRKEG